ncbi:hypothetical protein AN958_03884 [Leucoagaricus sp. SymC.cos]|nr:hypothetical protein AN958_03884 [Leucoagaricus sp. SymC.cos]
MGDLSAVPFAPRSSHNDLSSFTDSEIEEGDDYSDDYFHYDFPQPPSLSPALRRMRSSPWYSQPLEATARPERRHSVHDLLKARVHRKDAILSRRLNHLPPPTPAPSTPLPRLPRIIRKVASMRSEPKQEAAESLVTSRRPVPKIKSLKFMSGSMLGTSLQPPKAEERKRSWSLSRPASFQRPKAVPTLDAPYITLNSAGEHLVENTSSSRNTSVYASPAIYSNPYLAGSTAERHASSITFGPEGHFVLGRGATSLAPPFTHRTARSNVGASHRHSNHSCGESNIVGHSVSPGKSGSSISHERPGCGLHPPSQTFYGVSNGGKGKNASSGALLHGAKSFISITPERRKSRRDRSKSGSSSIGPGHEGGSVGHQVGSAMKEKGEKVKRLFARASSGVVDWGRQLTGRTAKSANTSSTSGSLAPLTGMRS